VIPEKKKRITKPKSPEIRNESLRVPRRDSPYSWGDLSRGEWRKKKEGKRTVVGEKLDVFLGKWNKGRCKEDTGGRERGVQSL